MNSPAVMNPIAATRVKTLSKPASSGSQAVDSTNLPLRILIVDDHAIVRDGLKQLLAHSFPSAEFGTASDAVSALDLVVSTKWDVMLLDISMPGQSGFDALRQFLLIQPALKILVLTMHSEDQYGLRVLKAGAAGYITKETAADHIVNAIQRVLGGGKYVSPSLAECLATALITPQDVLPHQTLSDREYQIMRLLASGKSVKEISYDLSLSIKTVSTYRTRFLKKLNLKTNADVIMYAIREKLVE
jgi:two-component system invasion response regulator UvrY